MKVTCWFDCLSWWWWHVKLCQGCNAKCQDHIVHYFTWFKRPHKCLPPCWRKPTRTSSQSFCIDWHWQTLKAKMIMRGNDVITHWHYEWGHHALNVVPITHYQVLPILLVYCYNRIWINILWFVQIYVKEVMILNNLIEIDYTLYHKINRGTQKVIIWKRSMYFIFMKIPYSLPLNRK